MRFIDGLSSAKHKAVLMNIPLLVKANNGISDSHMTIIVKMCLAAPLTKLEQAFGLLEHLTWLLN